MRLLFRSQRSAVCLALLPVATLLISGCDFPTVGFHNPVLKGTGSPSSSALQTVDFPSISNANDIWKSLQETKNCASPAGCVGYFGFAVENTGHYISGPDDQGNTSDGQLTADELAQLMTDVKALSGDQNGEPQCVMGAGTLADSQTTSTVDLTRVSGAQTMVFEDQGPAKCASGNFEPAQKLYLDLNLLMNKYYSLPSAGPSPSPSSSPTSSPSPSGSSSSGGNWDALTLTNDCGSAAAAASCLASSGFTVQSDGHYRAGPDANGLKFEGALTDGEKQTLADIANPLTSQDLSPELSCNSGQYFARGINTQVDWLAHGASQTITIFLGDPSVACYVADFNHSLQLQSQLAALAKKYYPVPFTKTF